MKVSDTKTYRNMKVSEQNIVDYTNSLSCADDNSWAMRVQIKQPFYKFLDRPTQHKIVSLQCNRDEHHLVPTTRLIVEQLQ